MTNEPTTPDPDPGEGTRPPPPAPPPSPLPDEELEESEAAGEDEAGLLQAQGLAVADKLIEACSSVINLFREVDDVDGFVGDALVRIGAQELPPLACVTNEYGALAFARALFGAGVVPNPDDTSQALAAYVGLQIARVHFEAPDRHGLAAARFLTAAAVALLRVPGEDGQSNG
jgi:hypothetical protein